jgi:Sap, sulfolipid-1-addressing protein
VLVETTFRIILYALVAATSPLALGATLAVLRTAKPRINGLVFAVSFVIAQAVILGIVFAIGVASLGDRKSAHETIAALFVLAFGFALLAAAALIRRRRGVPREKRPASPRTKAILDRLEHLTPRASAGTGVLLGIGGPKRLGITIITAGTVTAASLSRSEDVTLGALYVLLGTALVWIPVGLYVVFGKRATEWMNHAQGWVQAHQEPLTFYPTLVVGIALIGDALISLLGS